MLYLTNILVVKKVEKIVPQRSQSNPGWKPDDDATTPTLSQYVGQSHTLTHQLPQLVVHNGTAGTLERSVIFP